VDAGKIKALWIVATNPFHSWIDQKRLGRIREKLDFLVVQDMYHSTESARTADLVLPAAGWGEKTGCFINSERRIGTTKAVRKAPGMALSDFRIFRLIAHAWGCGDTFGEWTDPEAAFRILRDLTKDRPCDITGIQGYDHLDEQGGIQWPWPAAISNSKFEISNQHERRLFEDGCFFTPDGKARILFSPPDDLPEPTDANFPFTLLTGRGTSSQWHTQSRTAKSDILRGLGPSHAYVEMHPDDVAATGLRDGDIAVIRSRRGEMSAAVYPAPTVRRGEVFIPMHYPEVNCLTHPSFDPHSRQPSYKACAVAIAVQAIASPAIRVCAFRPQGVRPAIVSSSTDS
jgi:predicted molibdopterin-dependent oxidoreductase YjgC